MEETPKNREENVGGNGAEILSDMPSFEEHIKNMEKEESLGEKYYELAKAEREQWVEMARDELEYWEGLKPENTKVYEVPDAIFMTERWEQNGLSYRPLNVDNQREVAWFEEYRENRMSQAKKQVEKDENADLDELARCFRNQEIIEQIAAKLESGEDFTDEEVKFLGNAPDADDGLFDTNRFLTPDVCYIIHHGIFAIPDYSELLDQNSKKSIKWPQWATVARAQVREMTKQNRVLLHNDERVRSSLEELERRGEGDTFAGETNMNSATGEARSFTLEDNYPRLEGESEEEWANRLKKIRLKTRLAEKRQ